MYVQRVTMCLQGQHRPNKKISHRAERVIYMRKEMMELVGKEFSFTELDNEMMGLGCGTEFDSGLDWDEIAESGVILYAIDEEHHARVEFEVVSMHADDEIAEVTVIKVTNVEVEE